MNLILNQKQKFLVATAFHILVKDFGLPSETAKTLIYSVIIKELKNQNTTLEALDTLSRADRHIFIRRTANFVGEILVTKFGMKQSVVHDSISKFMKIMNEQSQSLRK